MSTIVSDHSDTHVSTADVLSASHRLKGISKITPLQYNERLSQQFEAEIFLKREDLQVVRSYKLRGAYNKMSLMSPEEKKRGIVCASAGNHAQGVAYACKALEIHGRVLMPETTPRLKVNKVKKFGGKWVEVILKGDTFDDAYHVARQMEVETNAVFIHPFDDPHVIAGQGTVIKEVLDQCGKVPEVIVAPIGGGGLCAGISTYLKQFGAQAPTLYGVEPKGAPAMYESLKQGKNIVLDEIEKFVDGAAVRQVGKLTMAICADHVKEVILATEGKVCTAMLDLYHEEAIVAEPAGALAIAALDQIADQIKGKRVVCILSGGNNDISRTEEIRERSLLDQGLKHYFMVRFPQRAGALKEFVAEVLGPTDDIVFFEYVKRNNRESGPAVVGIEYSCPEDHNRLVEKMTAARFDFESINHNPSLFQLLV